MCLGTFVHMVRMRIWQNETFCVCICYVNMGILSVCTCELTAWFSLLNVLERMPVHASHLALTCHMFHSWGVGGTWAEALEYNQMACGSNAKICEHQA